MTVNCLLCLWIINQVVTENCMKQYTLAKSHLRQNGEITDGILLLLQLIPCSSIMNEVAR